MIAAVISFYASSHPDGLEFVAGSTGFLDTAKDSVTANSPLADYGVAGVQNARLSGGVAGVIGVLVTLLLAGGLTWVLRRRSATARRPDGMGGGHGHGHALYYAADSPLHRAAGHVKILALLGFMIVVVATPGHWYAVFAGYLAILLTVVAVSRVPPGYLLPRMVVEVPFVVFALLVPFVSLGPAPRSSD